MENEFDDIDNKIDIDIDNKTMSHNNLRDYQYKCEDWLTPKWEMAFRLADILANLNHAFNFLLYTVASPQFREQLQALVSRRGRHSSTSSSSTTFMRWTSMASRREPVVDGQSSMASYHNASSRLRLNRLETDTGEASRNKRTLQLLRLDGKRRGGAGGGGGGGGGRQGHLL